MPFDELLTTETDRVEWKQSPDDSEGIYHAVCAMANDLGNTGQRGHVLVGVTREGAVCGVGPSTHLDDVSKRIADRLRATKLQPTPSFDIRTETLDDKHFVIVQVDPYPVPPVVTVNGRPWIRQGTTTRVATEADLLRLRERRPEQHQPFDVRPLPGTSLPDLDLVKLRQLHEASKVDDGEPETFPDLERWLTQRQLGRPVGGAWIPDAAAILLYGLSPQNFLPGARIEFVRYSGKNVDSPITARKSITGTLPDQLDGTWAQLADHIVSAPVPEAGIRAGFAPSYPVEALKELVRNLVQHRLYEGTNAPSRVEWYEDRIEFSNPGQPYGRASEGEFGSHSDYRNPLITQGLAQLGYVQQLGRGIRLVRLQLERNGNPPFEVQVDGYTRVTVRPRP